MKLAGNIRENGVTAEYNNNDREPSTGAAQNAMEGNSVRCNQNRLRQKQQNPRRHDQSMKIGRQRKIAGPEPMPKIKIS